TSGTYAVRGDTIAFYQGPAVWRYKWSVYRQALTFKKLGGQAPGCSLSVSLGQCEPTGLAVKPWRRVSGEHQPATEGPGRPPGPSSLTGGSRDLGQQPPAPARRAIDQEPAAERCDPVRHSVEPRSG